MIAGPHIVYRLYNATNVLLYVGMTTNWSRRRAQHRVVQPWFPEVAREVLAIYPTADVAHAEEVRAIQREVPRYNSHHKYTRFVGAKEIATMLGVRVTTAQRLIERGEFSGRVIEDEFRVHWQQVEGYRLYRDLPKAPRRPRTPKEQP